MNYWECASTSAIKSNYLDDLNCICICIFTYLLRYCYLFVEMYKVMYTK